MTDRTRFESAKEKYDRFLKIQGHLAGLVENYHKHCEKAHENFDLGMSRSYEFVVIVSAIGFLRAFEDYMEFEETEEVATYYTVMIMRNLFNDLIEEGLIGEHELTEEEAEEAVGMIRTILKVNPLPEEEQSQVDMVKWIVDMYERPNFNRFFYGFPCPVYSSKWIIHYCQSLAYNLLPHQAPDTLPDDTKKLIGEYLAANIEICCHTIIEDIKEGRFELTTADIKSGEIDMGETMRFSWIYSTTTYEMRETDRKLIGADEPPRFRLPDFGV